MKEKKICSHLKLDSYDVGIPLLKSMSDIMNLLQKHGISVETSSENLIIIKSKILSFDIDFYISLQFENESIRIVSMSPDGYLEGRDLYVRYKKVQQALERVLGRPQNVIQAIVNRLNPDASSFGWYINGIRIKHYLQDCFGMEEIINIDFSKSKLAKLAQISDEILRCVELEQKRINSGESSKWNPGVLQDIVYPEVKELLEHALDGEIFFRYGKNKGAWNLHTL